MKLSVRQALVMFDILKWTTSVHGTISGYDVDTRTKLVNEIIAQQNKEPVDLDCD